MTAGKTALETFRYLVVCQRVVTYEEPSVAGESLRDSVHGGTLGPGAEGGMLGGTVGGTQGRAAKNF
jgi:outer membrane lipoprotein SlyB